ncbi:6-phosphogluconate dehydrogenase [Schizophyllum commune]
MASSKDVSADRSRVCVFGAGNFGSCLADHLGDSNHEVFMWAREKEVIETFNTSHRNPVYLTDHAFSENITAIGPDFPDEAFIESMDVLIFAIPTQFLRQSLATLHPRFNEKKHPLLVFVNKGIEIGTNALTLEIITDTCGPALAKAAAFISGPSFAKEIIQRQPTSVSVASLTESEAEKTSTLFHQPHFRCYTGSDPIGLELSGALKNVYAIAAGMSDGLGYKNNTRAMIITRGLAEMARIGTAYGASPLTFLGLAGVGDLFLTCSSSNSRNYTVGYRLGQGESLDEIVKTLGSVAEGVSTAKGAKAIVDQMKVSAPIAESIYEVLYNGLGVKDAIRYLMELPPSKELDLPKAPHGPASRLLKKLGLDE